MLLIRPIVSLLTWTARDVRFPARVAGVAVSLLVVTAAPPGATGAADEVDRFRAAIEPLYRALADLQLVSVAGAPGLRIAAVQSAVFHERERLHARYGDRLVDAPDREVAAALETAYLSFTLYGLLVGQFGAGAASQNASADVHFQRGVAAMETIERFLRAK